MKKNLLRSTGYILLTILAITAAYFLFPHTNPLGGINLSVNIEKIQRYSENILDYCSISRDGGSVELRLRTDNEIIRQTQDMLGISEGNTTLREENPGFFWDVRWSFSDTAGGEDDHRHVRMKLDTHGKLIGFERDLPDSLDLQNISYGEARKRAKDFLLKFTSLVAFENDTAITDSVTGQARLLYRSPRNAPVANLTNQRMDYSFEWTEKNEILDNQITRKILLSGTEIKTFETDFGIPEKYTSEPDEFVLIALAISFFIGIAILTIYLAFKKSRAYELSFRLGLVLGGLVAVSFAIEFALNLETAAGWELIVPLIIAPFFYGGFLVVVWAVSESMGREFWKEKFVQLDLITRGYLLHSKIGESLLRGLMYGALTFLVLHLLIWLCGLFLPLNYLIKENSDLQFFSASQPALMILNHSIWANMYILAVNCILVISFLFSKIGKTWLVIAIAAIPISFMNMATIHPVYIGLVIEPLAFSIITWLFFRSNIFTVFTALFMLSIIEPGFALTTAAGILSGAPSGILIFTLVFLFIYAIITQFTRDSVSDFTKIEPAIARFISERQRMKQELDVAREVQMSFLPQKNPDFPGLQIASRCVPAFEVGGDYYDFVEQGDARLGVAIGDVSGKGTQASFYMTLVKGFLKALAINLHSPAEILIAMNALFFENATRDTFISMVLAIFDMENRTMTLASSGHNPVLMYRKSGGGFEQLHCRGLAIGLESGETFNRMMQERKIQFEPGDVFVFYTDGITEAMNPGKEEYGEIRLQEQLESLTDAGVEHILDHVISNVDRFMKKAAQHDDMTIVVIKID